MNDACRSSLINLYKITELTIYTTLEGGQIILEG